MYYLETTKKALLQQEAFTTAPVRHVRHAGNCTFCEEDRL